MTPMTQSTDRIEKERVLRAPRARVWRAITDAKEFGSWFGVVFESGFVPGKKVRGKLTHPQYAHVPFDISIERIHPEDHFSFRWHPHPLEKGVDYSAEPTTLIAFELSDIPEGTLLKITESGFDRIPRARWEEAYRGNEKGWDGQLKAIAKYVGDTP